MYSSVNNSRIEILGVFETAVSINDIDTRVKFFVIPNTMMVVAALLGRDFLSNLTVKVKIDGMLQVSQNTSNSLVKSDDFPEQILHIDCADQEKDKSELNINPNASIDAILKVKEIYTDAYRTSGKPHADV